VVFKKSIIKNIDGIRVGIFGLSTPETSYKTSPKNVMGYQFLSPQEIAKEQVSFLKSQNVDIIIALVHLGVDESTQIQERSTAIAMEGVDLIIDGHSHSVLNNGMLVNKTLIVQSGALSNNLGKVIINFDENTKSIKMKASLINVKETLDVKEDSDIVSIIKKYQEKNAKITSKKITTIDFNLEGSRDIVRSSQRNLGKLIALSLKQYSNADIALINSGGIRASIAKGSVSYGDVISVLPFGNYGIVLELSGADIIEVLEYGMVDLPNPSGKLLQVAGISFDVNITKKNNRVSNVMIADEKLDLKKYYKVATTDFTAIGGDGYTMLVNKKILSNEKSLDEIFADYLTKININNTNLIGDIKIVK
jgi:5'-nucleotidase